MIFTSDLLARALPELASRLADAGLTAVIHIVGGSAIALSTDPDRTATQDVDAWLNANLDTKIEAFAIAAQMAHDHGWRQDWLNENAVMFIPDSVGGIDSEHWRHYHSAGSVDIVLAAPDVLFAMKLRAARGRRDTSDLDRLAGPAGATTADDAFRIFDTYFPHDDLKPTARAWISRHFTPE